MTEVKSDMPTADRPLSVRCPYVNRHFVCHNFLILSETGHKYLSPKWALLKTFSRSEVKGQGHGQNERYSDMHHFDGVESKLICLSYKVLSNSLPLADTV